MIDGVKVKQLKAISDERGRLMEMLRWMTRYSKNSARRT